MDQQNKNTTERFEMAGYSLFCQIPLSRAIIAIRAGKKKADKAINLLSYLVGLAGLGMLIWWFIENHTLINNNPWDLVYFWQTQDWRILLFLISIFFDLFLVYRQSERKYDLRRIKPLRERAANQRLLNHNIGEALSDNSLYILEQAFLAASKLRQPEVTTRHLFWAMLHDQRIRMLWVRLSVDGAKLIERLKKYLADPELKASLVQRVDLSSAVQRILLASFVDAYKRKQKAIEPLNMIMYCIESDPVIKEILYDLEVTEDKLNNGVAWFRINEQLRKNYLIYKQKARFKPGNAMNRSYTAVATPTLDRFSHDLTLAAKYGYLEMCVARDKEIISIFEALGGGHNGVLLTGPVGVGKRAIINGIAQLMVKEEVPEFLQDKRLVELDVSRLVAGANPSEAQQRLLMAINETLRAGNIVLFLENLENIAGISAGGEQSLELSEVLAEALNRHQIYCLATANSNNYAQYIEGQALGDAMTTIPIMEPDLNQAIQMIESKVGYFEGKYGIYFSYNALEQAVKLSERYIKDKHLPQKALDVLQTTAAHVHQRCQVDKKLCACTREDIALTINEITKIPVAKLTEDESQKLLNLEDEIHTRMIDQEEAVKAVSAALRRARAEMREGNRPIASFLFLGPTGVGKTELAKSVADKYFGDENYMIRLDMSEYQHPDSVNKMIGDADSLGYLTEKVRKQPFALVLLDEVEKAHPDILNLFLQMMDDGRLTDGQGRTIDFTNSIIIATSNAGANYIQDEIIKGTGMEIIKEGLIEEHLTQVMRPELINRFDGIIVFKTLSSIDVLAITKLMLKKMGKMLEKKGIALKVDELGAQTLAQQGYDPKFGARPLRRLLQDTIENEIANKVLAQELQRRDTIFINPEGKVEVIKAREI